MTEKTITFTPASDLKRGIFLFFRGIALVFKSLARLYNNSVHKYPWVHIVIIALALFAVSFVRIAEARSERDALNKKNYQLQQRLDSVTNELEARGGTYVGN